MQASKPEIIRAGQLGFSLLEVLVTLVVLSLGILGLAGLQSAALKNGHSALLRAQAAQYAQDMADRMRANRQRALDITAAAPSPYDMAMTSTPPSGDNLADKDRAGWVRQLQALPGGAGAIAVDGNGNATVTVRWVETAFGNTALDPACPEPRQAGQVCFVLNTRL